MCSGPLLLFLSPGRCASCGENVVGEGTGCTAMDQVFHVDCFVCMTCSTKLRGKPFFAVEKKAYCEPCYIVSNFFPCLTAWYLAHSGYLCVHVSKVHIMISGPGTLAALNQEFLYIFTSDKHISFLESTVSLTSHLIRLHFLFSLSLFCFWSLNETDVFFIWKWFLAVTQLLLAEIYRHKKCPRTMN